METETRHFARINQDSNEMKEQPNPVHQPKTGMRARTNKATQPECAPVLVNRHHPWTESPEDTDSRLAPVSAFPDIQALDSNIRLQRVCLQRLDALLDAVGGKTGIVVVSGYRDLAEQTKIYSSSLRENGAEYTAKFVALPGCSEHHTGLAVDVGSAAGGLDFIAPEFPDDGVCGAFKAKAAEFGFVQRYKAHKEHLTGISCEPWHFRYVGAPHAAIMEERDLCLEEYVEVLRQERAKALNKEASYGN